MANKPCLWVVEMLSEPELGSNWEPTVGARLTREDGRRELANWKRRNPGTRFRLTTYIREEKRRGK